MKFFVFWDKKAKRVLKNLHVLHALHGKKYSRLFAVKLIFSASLREI